MERVEHDVYVSYREPSGAALARSIAAGLARRGFKVVSRNGAWSVASGAWVEASDSPEPLKIVEEPPDFVLLLTPNCLDGCAADDVMRLEIARAIETERNIVPVVVGEYEHPASLPADLVRLRTRHAVRYSQARHHESVARVAHRLSSDASVDERHMMRDARRIGVAVGLLAVALLTIAAVRTLPGMIGRYFGSRPLAPMTLYWAGFGQRPAGGSWIEIPIKDGSAVAAGDELRVVFSTSADGYAYVLCRDLRGEISVLFPGRSLKGGSRVRAGQLYAAPVGGAWWTLDQGVGADRLYVFASYDSIENLESLSDEREESAADRQAMLDSTIEGLLDGKHGSTPGRVRTRTGRAVLRSLERRPALLTAAVTLASGKAVTRSLSAEQGLLSAMVEVRVGPEK